MDIFGYYSQPKASAWVKTDPNATTNKIASLRTDIAEKERRIAQLSNENEKLNKQKMQSTTLLNGLQRENCAKDALVHQAKREIGKLKKELREKDSTISTMSTKVRYNTRKLPLINLKDNFNRSLRGQLSLNTPPSL